MIAVFKSHQPRPNVCGCMADNWMLDKPALQVNPEASPVALLGWCYGEVVSLRAVAAAVGSVECDLEADDMNAIFSHRLGPLVEVLRHAVDLLRDVEREAGRA